MATAPFAFACSVFASVHSFHAAAFFLAASFSAFKACNAVVFDDVRFAITPSLTFSRALNNRISAIPDAIVAILTASIASLTAIVAFSIAIFARGIVVALVVAVFAVEIDCFAAANAVFADVIDPFILVGVTTSVNPSLYRE